LTSSVNNELNRAQNEVVTT